MSEDLGNLKPTAEGGETPPESTNLTQSITETEKQSKKDERAKLSKELAQAKARESELTRLLEEAKENKLKEQNDWKTLAETYKTRAEQAEIKNKSFMEEFFTEKKRTALYQELSKLGLRAEAEQDLDLLDLSGIAVERTDHGRVIPHGADLEAQKIKQARPHWFKSATAPKINTGGANAGPIDGPVTPEMLLKLEKQDPAKYKIMYQKYIEQKKKA